VNLADRRNFLRGGWAETLLREMTGQSLPLLAGKKQRDDMAFVERERHANVRAGDLSYRAGGAIQRILFIETYAPSAGRQAIRKSGKGRPVRRLRRFAEQEFILTIAVSRSSQSFSNSVLRSVLPKSLRAHKDPHQISNVADRPEFAATKKKLRATLDRWMKDTKDPRATSDSDPWDSYPLSGGRVASLGRILRCAGFQASCRRN
jgi:hypothetical protein